MNLEELYFLNTELKSKIPALEREFYEFFRTLGFITSTGKHDLCTESILCTVPSDVIIPMFKTFTRGISKMKMRVPPRGPGYVGYTDYELTSITSSISILINILLSCENLINTWLNMLHAYDISVFTPIASDEILDAIGDIKEWYSGYLYILDSTTSSSSN